MKLIFTSLILPAIVCALPKHHSFEDFSKALRNERFSAQPTWQAPAEGDVRSPCPMMNSLANHGILPHAGREISKDTLVAALSDFLLLDTGVASFLADQALQVGYEREGHHYFDLDGLQKHNVLEHDASLTRQDAFLGNNTVFDASIYESLREFTTKTESGEYLSLDNLGRYRKLRQKTCQEQHPETYSLSFKGQTAAAAEGAIAYMMFKDETNMIRMSWLDVFFKKERLPFELGWETRKISTADFMKATAKVLFLQNF